MREHSYFRRLALRNIVAPSRWLVMASPCSLTLTSIIRTTPGPHLRRSLRITLLQLNLIRTPPRTSSGRHLEPHQDATWKLHQDATWKPHQDATWNLIRTPPGNLIRTPPGTSSGRHLEPHQDATWKSHQDATWNVIRGSYSGIFHQQHDPKPSVRGGTFNPQLMQFPNANIAASHNALPPI